MLDTKKVTGRAKGGKATNAKKTPEERKAQSIKMAEAKKHLASLPKATHLGLLKIMDTEIQCYVLANGQRVLSQRGISEAFTGSRGGGATENSSALKMPRFLTVASTKSQISADLMVRLSQPVEFKPSSGRSAFGYDAALLPEICEVVIDSARHNETTNSFQCKTAETLIRGFARLGIIALVDEATGYQKDRARDALAKILEAFVAKEIQPWIRTFDPEYYEHMFRLRNWHYPPEKSNYRPQVCGTLTNNIIYKRLAPGVLKALKDEAKKDAKKTHLHRHLTANYGRQELLKHLGLVTGLMKISTTWDSFLMLLDRVSPKFGDTMPLDLDE